jgi:methyl-accepting chemotaxis protein
VCEGKLFPMPLIPRGKRTGKRLHAAFRDAAAGNLDFRISHLRKDEFGELFDGFNRFAAVVQDRIDAAENGAVLVRDVSMEATRINLGALNIARIARPHELHPQADIELVNDGRPLSG